MQQNNYVEAEEAYRRALSIASDNNKMCNLGICLMKQGRIGEAKETLFRVKPAVPDGPRGSDSHLKAYERAQQMLKDLESEMMTKGGGDRIEQKRLFEAFLGSSSIWQPQPCKDHTSMPAMMNNSVKTQDEFADENINSNIVANPTAAPLQKGSKQVANMLGNSLNVAAPPFYGSKSFKEPMQREPIENPLSETLKRTRSGNAAGSMRVNDVGEFNKLHMEVPVPENKTRRLSSEDNEKNKLTDLLPDNKDFEDAILAAILEPANESDTTNDTSTSSTTGIFQSKTDKRLKVFRDITLSLSPRA